MEKTYTDVTDHLQEILDYHLFTINQQPITVGSLLLFVVLIMAIWVVSQLFNRIVLVVDILEPLRAHHAPDDLDVRHHEFAPLNRLLLEQRPQL